MHKNDQMCSGLFTMVVEKPWFRKDDMSKASAQKVSPSGQIRWRHSDWVNEIDFCILANNVCNWSNGLDNNVLLNSAGFKNASSNGD